MLRAGSLEASSADFGHRERARLQQRAANLILFLDFAYLYFIHYLSNIAFSKILFIFN